MVIKEGVAPSLERPLDELVEILEFSYMWYAAEFLKQVLAPRDFRVAKALLSGFNTQASDKQIADILIRNSLLPTEVEIYNANDHEPFIFSEHLLNLMASLGVVPSREYTGYQFPLGREIEHLCGLLSWDSKDVTVNKIPASSLLEFSRPTKLRGISVVVGVNEDKPGNSRTREQVEFQYINIVVSPDAYSTTV